MLDDVIVRRRVGALVGLVLVAGALALLLRDGNNSELEALEFAAAWEAQDFAAMHATLAPSSQRKYSVEELTAAYVEAQATATVTGIGIEGAQSAIDADDGKVVPVDLVLRTGIFGNLETTLAVPVAEDGIRWAPNLAFPGLAEGQELVRETVAPKRGSILARDGSLIAGGPPEARSGEIAGATHIAGSVGIPTEELAAAAQARGFPDDAPVGTSGLELALDKLLSGKPGGKLIASSGGRQSVLAESDPVPGRDVKTTIDPAAQAATTAALGAQFGGIAVLDEGGAIRALAGVAFSAPQPPGSTFKLVTAVAGLESGETSIGEEFPVTTGEFVGGREIQNAHDELCGGTLVESFAHSCNSVFAPLGVRIGAEKLVETAELLGFNQEPDLLAGKPVATGTAEPSTIPSEFASDLDLGVSAIGQGRVLATPLGMASATQAVAAAGKRTPPYIYRGKGKVEKVRTMSGKTARQTTAMMEAVVSEGTALSAQIPGIRVAGKTGTAELGPKPGQEIPPPDPENPDAPPPEIEMEVDAWFTAFAPADKPQLVVTVMLVNAAGDGGEVAAPLAKQILESLL